MIGLGYNFILPVRTIAPISVHDNIHFEDFGYTGFECAENAIKHARPHLSHGMPTRKTFHNILARSPPKGYI
jgi:hypothetical protein